MSHSDPSRFWEWAGTYLRRLLLGLSIRVVKRTEKDGTETTTITFDDR